MPAADSRPVAPKSDKTNRRKYSLRSGGIDGADFGEFSTKGRTFDGLDGRSVDLIVGVCATTPLSSELNATNSDDVLGDVAVSNNVGGDPRCVGNSRPLRSDRNKTNVIDGLDGISYESEESDSSLGDLIDNGDNGDNPRVNVSDDPGGFDYVNTLD